MSTTRPPAVAGLFYPAGAAALERAVRGFLAGPPADEPAPKALIVPHAGYPYSGPVAGAGYRRLAPARAVTRRVVLLGPAHRVPVRGVAVPACDAFATPLGTVELDAEALRALAGLAGVATDERAHAGEHSLEVQLPFLQVVLEAFRLVPVLVGGATPGAVADLLERLWGGAETRIVVSSDLSHYHDLQHARRLDEETARAIEERQPGRLDDRRACGHAAVGGLLEAARRRALPVRRLALATSADTAGTPERVVGYGAFAVG